MCDIESSPACTRVKARSFPRAQHHRGQRRSSDAGHRRGHRGVAVEGGRLVPFDLRSTCTTTGRMFGGGVSHRLAARLDCRRPAMHLSLWFGWISHVPAFTCPTLPVSVAFAPALTSHFRRTRETPRVCSVRHIGNPGNPGWPPMR